MSTNWQKAKEILKNDGVVVIPTDTLYGVVGRALSKEAVEKIYKIKRRKDNKPFIVLISSYKDLEIFGVKIKKDQAKFLEKIWPGEVSVVLPCKLKKWEYLHRGTYSIAFRMVKEKNKNLFELINKVGPLVAPSANLEGGRPAENIKEAKSYFGKNIPLYVNGPEKTLNPSTLIKFENGGFVILRQGDIIIPQV